jgi:hypothetical protein
LQSPLCQMPCVHSHLSSVKLEIWNAVSPGPCSILVLQPVTSRQNTSGLPDVPAARIGLEAILSRGSHSHPLGGEAS